MAALSTLPTLPALAPVAPLPDVTIPLNLLIPVGSEHYFNRSPDRRFTRRRFTFRGAPVFLPLVHAFLGTCAAEQGPEYRHLFDLLGTELAANAMAHTLSGEPGGTFTLLVERGATALTLTCRDEGTAAGWARSWEYREYLRARPFAEALTAESGRGLAIVDALSSSWGENGRPALRQVWLRLDYDLTDSAWPTA